MNREIMRQYLLSRGFEIRTLKDCDIASKQKDYGFVKYTLMEKSWKLEQKRETKDVKRDSWWRLRRRATYENTFFNPQGRIKQKLIYKENTNPYTGALLETRDGGSEIVSAINAFYWENKETSLKLPQKEVNKKIIDKLLGN